MSDQERRDIINKLQALVAALSAGQDPSKKDMEALKALA